MDSIFLVGQYLFGESYHDFEPFLLQVITHFTIMNKIPITILYVPFK